MGIQHIYEIRLVKRKKSAICYKLSDIGENEINQMQKDKYVEFRYLESKIVKVIEAGSRMLETWGREKWGDVGKGVQNFSLCKVNQFWRLMYKNVTIVNHIILYIWNLPKNADIKYLHQVFKYENYCPYFIDDKTKIYKN